jgi:hypothetical protein
MTLLHVSLVTFKLYHILCKRKIINFDTEPEDDTEMYS